MLAWRFFRFFQWTQKTETTNCFIHLQSYFDCGQWLQWLFHNFAIVKEKMQIPILMMVHENSCSQPVFYPSRRRRRKKNISKSWSNRKALTRFFWHRNTFWLLSICRKLASIFKNPSRIVIRFHRLIVN